MRGRSTESVKYDLRGIVVSLNTPFAADNRIDYPSCERLVEWHLQQGAVGFLAPAQAGEVGELALEERIGIVRFLRGATHGRARLFAGATAQAEQESLALARAAVECACDGVLVEVPHGLRRDRSGLIAFFRRFAAAGMQTMMIQDLDWNGPGLDVETIVELLESIPSFRSIKVEVVPAGPKYSAVREATRGRLHICGGWAAAQMIEALQRGVDVFVPTAMTGIYHRVMQSFDRGDLDSARSFFHSMLPVLAFTHQHIEISIQFYKRLFHHRRIFSTPRVRRNTIPYDAWHESYGRLLIDYLDRLEFEPDRAGWTPTG